MPIISIENLKFVKTDYSFSEKYWPVLTAYFKGKYGNLMLTDPSTVQEGLKDCFEFFCSKFMNLLASENRATFFAFAHYLHEDSCVISNRVLQGEEMGVDREDLAGVRRILKCILEQGCTMQLKGHPIFMQEILENKDIYEKHLDELLYLGQKAFEYMEYTARSQLYPKSISLGISEDQLTTFTNPPFNSIFDFIFSDIPKHNEKVETSNCLIEMKQVLNDEVGLNYDDLAAPFFINPTHPSRRTAPYPLEELIEQLSVNLGYSKDSLETFYSGLTLSSSNVLTIQESLLRTQNSNRYIYRPILKYNIDGKAYYFIGVNKWIESFNLIQSNCIPFGQYPDEWKKLKPLHKFMSKVSNTHDKILEDPAIKLLASAGLKHDRNIKYFRKRNNQNTSIDKAGLGEIDIIFIDEIGKTIYVIECKDNRARFEYNNWKRDIYNFNETYELQLKNKFQWVEANKELVLDHFDILYGTTIANKTTYAVKPMFLINAPTLYMYDSEYTTFTLHDLELFLNHKHVEIEFNGKLGSKNISLRKPYFKNFDKL